MPTRAQLYFIAVLYSFALHLRRGTYRALPLSRPVPLSVPISNATPAAAGTVAPQGILAALTGGWSTAGQRGPSYAYAHLRNGSAARDLDLDEVDKEIAELDGRKSTASADASGRPSLAGET